MRSTVTPRTSLLPSLMAKKAEAAGDTTMPPRNFPVGQLFEIVGIGHAPAFSMHGLAVPPRRLLSSPLPLWERVPSECASMSVAGEGL